MSNLDTRLNQADWGFSSTKSTRSPYRLLTRNSSSVRRGTLPGGLSLMLVIPMGLQPLMQVTSYPSYLAAEGSETANPAVPEQIPENVNL